MSDTTATPTSRSVAADALLEFESKWEYADELLSRHLTASPLRGSDRSLAADLFWGSIRWRGRLDAVLAPVFHGDFSRSHPLIRVLLRMGVYQLFCADRIPDHATVSQTVQIAVDRLGKSAAGLINAILRRLARERDRWNALPETADEISQLSFIYSHPKWIIRNLLDRFSADEVKSALEANNSRAPLTVCTTKGKMTESELESYLDGRSLKYEPSRYLKGYYRLTTQTLSHLQPLLDAGKVTVQDESAGLAVELLTPEPGERVLDMCAAPGGKTIAVYGRMQWEGHLTAADDTEGRISLLRTNLERVGAREVDVRMADGRTLQADPFDRILVDAPCSSLGLLRKRPDVRWRRKSRHLPPHQKLQRELLDHAADLLKPDGVMVYSTCTILPSENQEVVNSFLKSHPEFHKEDARGFVPETVVNSHGDLETFTHVHGTDGSFAVRLRRA